MRSDILLAILRIDANSHLQSLACSNVERSVSKSDAFLSAVLVAVFSHCSEAALVVHAYCEGVAVKVADCYWYVSGDALLGCYDSLCSLNNRCTVLVHEDVIVVRLVGRIVGANYESGLVVACEVSTLGVDAELQRQRSLSLHLTGGILVEQLNPRLALCALNAGHEVAESAS